MNKRVSLALIATVTFVILLSYQNCGVEAPQSMFDVVQGYKLPYEAKADQIAYMSCSEQQDVPNDSGVYFTFRVGAYGDEAGLRLSETFLYETRRDDPDERATKLEQESGSLNYRLQFSIRQQNDLGTMYKNEDSGQGIEEVDYDFVFGDLGSSEMNASLVLLDTDQYLNYWSAGGVSQDAYMQGTMVFNTSENLAANLRTFMTEKGILTMGYSLPDDPGQLLTRGNYNTDTADDDGDGKNNDADDDTVPSNEAYGVGLRMSFTRPNPANWSYSGSPHVNMPKRVLSSIQEYDLTKPTVPKTSWSCPTSLQLRIVFPDDIAVTDHYPLTSSVSSRPLCPDAADPTTPASEVENFQRVRRSLPASDWKINWAQKCVVPVRYTKGSCYGVNTAVTPSVTRNPEYNMTQTCDPVFNPTCAHFVSICYKP